MATLIERQKEKQDELVSGVIESIVTVNKWFDILGFDRIEGAALSYPKRERGTVLQGPIPGDMPDDQLTLREQKDLDRIRRIREIEVPGKSTVVVWHDEFACITLGERVEL